MSLTFCSANSRSQGQQLPVQGFGSTGNVEKTISQAGADGKRGSDGSGGADGSGGGSPAKNGDDNNSGDGRDGSNGTGKGGNGTSGTDATHATSGADAKPITLQVSGAPGELVLAGTVSDRVKLKDGLVVAVVARGGDGGDGGRGGDGGAGGTGQDGGRGGRGGPGRDADTFGHDGKQGCHGGKGGSGGAGGNGAKSGKGGDAGNGGNGAAIQISCSPEHAHLLAHLSTDVRAGSAGRAGDAGRPGSSGKGGKGGDGGAGGRGGRAIPNDFSWSGWCPGRKAGVTLNGDTQCSVTNQVKRCGFCHTMFCNSCHYTESGQKMRAANVCGSCGKNCHQTPGRDGKEGNKGSAGHKGSDGSSGGSGGSGQSAKAGKSGSIKFTVGSESSDRLYSIDVLGFRVREAAEAPLGCFEPGAAAVVDSFVVGNSGGLTLPAGATIKLYDCDGCEVTGGVDTITLPSIPPGGSVTLDGGASIALRVKPFAPPATADALPAEPFSQHFQFSVGGRMAGRAFGSGHLRPSIESKWRVGLLGITGAAADVVPTEGVFAIAPSEHIDLLAPLKDQLARGSAAVAASAVRVRAALGAETVKRGDLFFDANGGAGGGDRGGALVSPSAPVSVGAVAQLPIPPVTCAHEAPVFRTHILEVNLELCAAPGVAVPTDAATDAKGGAAKGGAMVIQRRVVKMRVAMEYEVPSRSSPAKDVLFFCTQQIDTSEFGAWSFLLSSLGLSFDPWDVVRYAGISTDARTGKPSKWVGHHNEAMLLLPVASDATASLLDAKDILAHLGRDPADAAALTEVPDEELEADAAAAGDDGEGGGDDGDGGGAAGAKDPTLQLKSAASAVESGKSGKEADKGGSEADLGDVGVEMDDDAEELEEASYKPMVEASYKGIVWPSENLEGDTQTKKSLILAEKLNAPAPTSASVCILGEDPSALSRRLFDASTKTVTMPKHKFAVSSVKMAMVIQNDREKFDKMVRENKKDLYLIGQHDRHDETYLNEHDGYVRAKQLVAEQSKRLPAYRWRHDDYAVPRVAEPISDGTVLNRVVDGALAMLGGKVHTKYSYGTLRLRRFEVPRNAKLVNVASPMLRYRSADAKPPFSLEIAQRAAGQQLIDTDEARKIYEKIDLGQKEQWRRKVAEGAVWLAAPAHAAWLERTAKLAAEEGTADNDAAAEEAAATYRAFCNLKAFADGALFKTAASTDSYVVGRSATESTKRCAAEAERIGLVTPQLLALRQKQATNQLGTARPLFEAELDCVAGGGSYAPISIRYDFVDRAFYSSEAKVAAGAGAGQLSAPSTPRTAREIMRAGGGHKQGLELPPRPPAPASDLNLSREPFDPTTATELPVPSRFVSAAMAIVAAMPIERKGALLVQCTRTDLPTAPRCASWTLRVALLGEKAPPTPFAAAIEAAIYFELKAELGVGLERLPATSRFVKWCLQQPHLKLQPGQSAQLLESQAAVWSVLLRLMSVTQGAASSQVAASVVQKIAKTASAKQRERARLVYLHRALKSHLLGGHYAAVKKAQPKEYAALRKAAEARAKRTADKARLKLRYLVQLQLPALGDTDAEVDAQQRLKNVLATKKIVQNTGSRDVDDRKARDQLESRYFAMTLEGGAKMVKQKTVDTLLRRKSAR